VAFRAIHWILLLGINHFPHFEIDVSAKKYNALIFHVDSAGTKKWSIGRSCYPYYPSFGIFLENLVTPHMAKEKLSEFDIREICCFVFD